VAIWNKAAGVRRYHRCNDVRVVRSLHGHEVVFELCYREASEILFGYDAYQTILKARCNVCKMRVDLECFQASCHEWRDSRADCAMQVFLGLVREFTTQCVRCLKYQRRLALRVMLLQKACKNHAKELQDRESALSASDSYTCVMDAGGLQWRKNNVALQAFEDDFADECDELQAASNSEHHAGSPQE
jgi:hypothetical protein